MPATSRRAALQLAPRSSWRCRVPTHQILRVSKLFALAIPITLLCSCYSLGHAPTLSEMRPLELGQLRSDVNFEPLGIDGTIHTEVTENGRSEMLRYGQVRVSGIGTAQTRVVLLEFKDGRLNGFHQLSQFPEDRLVVDLGKVKMVESGIGALTRDQLMAELGVPHGKALSPTRLFGYRELCAADVAEIWGWSRPVQYISGFLISSDVLVGFDSSGRVSRVTVRDHAHELDRGSGIRPFVWDE